MSRKKATRTNSKAKSKHATVSKPQGTYEEINYVRDQVRYSLVPETGGVAKLLSQPGYSHHLPDPNRFLRDVTILKRDTRRLINQANEIAKRHEGKSGPIPVDQIPEMVSAMEDYNVLATRFSLVSGPATEAISRQLLTTNERYQEAIRQQVAATPQVIPVNQPNGESQTG